MHVHVHSLLHIWSFRTEGGVIKHSDGLTVTSPTIMWVKVQQYYYRSILASSPAAGPFPALQCCIPMFQYHLQLGMRLCTWTTYAIHIEFLLRDTNAPIYMCLPISLAGTGPVVSEDESGWFSLWPCGGHVRLWAATWQCLLEGGEWECVEEPQLSTISGGIAEGIYGGKFGKIHCRYKDLMLTK